MQTTQCQICGMYLELATGQWEATCYNPQQHEQSRFERLLKDS